MDPGQFFTVLVVVLVVAALVAVTVHGANPVCEVADELVTPARVAEVDGEIAVLVRDARRLTRRRVLDGTYLLTYRRLRGVMLLLAILTFPLGLLLLPVASQTFVLTISVTPEGSGSRIRVVGRVHRKFAEAIGAALQRRFARTSAAV